MLDALPDAIAMFDSCGRLQGCNRVMRGLLGVPELVNGTADLIDFFQRLENGDLHKLDSYLFHKG